MESFIFNLCAVVWVTLLLIEAIVLKFALKYKGFGKGLAHAILLNIFTLCAYLIFRPDQNFRFPLWKALPLILLCFFVSTILKTLVLLFLNRKDLKRRLLFATTMMNLVSYGINVFLLVLLSKMSYSFNLP